ncbi:DUF4908 domain-containing protein [Caulobacter sp. KR2-114]|uniref:DUF4908 domain-containing protein n=1 Tax=Caulobacter sp. KR2-114 TaxID=3400912 RepID=UPI003BFAFE55
MAKLAGVLRVLVASCVMATSGVAIAGSTPLGAARSDPAAALYAKLFQAALRASRAAHHIVSFDTPDADAGVDQLYPLAAARVSDAIVAMAAAPGGRRLLTQVDAVRLEQGPAGGVRVEGRTVVITVNPSMGESSCPSTAAIERTLWRSLSSPAATRS